MGLSPRGRFSWIYGRSGDIKLYCVRIQQAARVRRPGCNGGGGTRCACRTVGAIAAEIVQGSRSKAKPVATSNSASSVTVLPASIPTWRAAYSDRTASVMAQFCGLAYHSFSATSPGGADLRTNDPGFAKAEPPARLELASSLAALGFELLATVSDGSANAFLAQGPGFAVLAFRGAQTRGDWEVDVNAAQVSMALPDGRGAVRVHSGFYTTFQPCQAKLQACLDALPTSIGLYIT